MHGSATTQQLLCRDKDARTMASSSDWHRQSSVHRVCQQRSCCQTWDEGRPTASSLVGARSPARQAIWDVGVFKGREPWLCQGSPGQSSAATCRCTPRGLRVLSVFK
jgi:hypothetical protein